MIVQEAATAVPEIRAAGYTRDVVKRMLGLSERQLQSWEKQDLVTALEHYEFSDLLALKTLVRLRDLGARPVRIRQAIDALRLRLTDVEHPLVELRMTVEDGKITVHVSGTRMEPLTGQLLLDFDAREIEKLRSFPVAKPAEAAPPAGDEQASEVWFQKGLTLEETGAPAGEAIAAYKKAIEANPNACGALVNLGTIYFRLKRLKEAAECYSRALQSDPDYALAHFNLGNLYDEQGQVEVARGYYLTAIRLNSRYADAYFNLALLCERNNEILQAIGYWQQYLKLDATSEWARAARKQLDRLKSSVRQK